MKNNTKKYKLWGNAFTKTPDELMIKFTAGNDIYSIPPTDESLVPFDIKLNIAHVKMLYKQKIISKKEHNKLISGLKQILTLWKKGKFKLDPYLEDVHTNIENWLSIKYGIETGGKIHTGRSRNDQIVTDMFLYLHSQIDSFLESLNKLNNNLIQTSKKYTNTICPGYTHHQHAAVTSFGLILHSFYTAFKRDIYLFKQIQQIYNYSPLGSSTGYGTLINIDSEFTAKELGFNKPFENPIDVITNRGEFETAVAFALSQFTNHTSCLAQTLILFSTTEFGFIKLADKFSTGSSVMPQKKNPDPLEIIKAIAAIVSNSVSVLQVITQKNMIGYNRDTQETKHIICHLIQKTCPIPMIIQEIIKSLIVFPEKMYIQANKAFINSMGLMELIINKTGIPMRKAKILIEKSIKKTIIKGENNKIVYEAFIEAQKELDLQLDISKDELNEWQDAQHQFDSLKTYF